MYLCGEPRREEGQALLLLRLLLLSTRYPSSPTQSAPVAVSPHFSTPPNTGGGAPRR